jgi:ParB family transcriptional regulator, chromosome partitioning protein
VLIRRPVLAVGLLTAHPGNVRRDLGLSTGFVASVEANGILVPLRVTRDPGGGYRVIDGHRRLAAAVATGQDTVPVDLAEERAGDEPGQYLDMWTSHRHRAPLSLAEQADALFAAHEAGASKTRIRKSTGLKPPQVGAALAGGRLSGGTRETVEALPAGLTLEDLAIFAEFDGDQAAIARLSDTCRWGGSLEHQAELLRQDRAARAAHERLRAELTTAGVTVTGTLPPGAHLLATLRHDGGHLTPDAHAGCPGRGAFFRSYDLSTPVYYCADPAAHGHTVPGSGDGATPTTGTNGTPDPGGTAGQPDMARRLVVEGNRAWKAAAEARKRWLAAHLFARRTAPREAAPFIARQLLGMPDPLRQGLAAAHSRLAFSEITGHHADRWAQACDTTPAARLPLLMLSPAAVAYEEAMTAGKARTPGAPAGTVPVPASTPGSTSPSWPLPVTSFPASSKQSPTAHPGPAAPNPPAPCPLTPRPPATRPARLVSPASAASTPAGPLIPKPRTLTPAAPLSMRTRPRLELASIGAVSIRAGGPGPCPCPGPGHRTASCGLAATPIDPSACWRVSC